MATTLSEKNIHEMIKSATQPLHERVEILNPLSKKVPSLDDYTLYLKCFLQFIEPIENKLIEFYSEFTYTKSDYSLKRSILIKNDLENLGIINIKLKSNIKMPVLISAANSLGVLYVLEGSNLGGQFLYKKLKAIHGDKISNSLSFLQGNGTDTFKYWQAFLAFMQEYSDKHPSENEAIIQSAIETFACFEQIFL
ncbi:biliverdin-producing heme oxygenase [Fluviispira sanaruensis]|uniref:Biliverdin-producing heme oxygenase n=1 Tax=Fluviispira sanaruensis TaxID=2493639 RepID=A0A4P2VJW5_FLUSA|nr:biliverdin-producing heme oxygenase [Fluviispira sanaruensis]BBH53031.1 biliverdin-producing heme oxygenase [Fluviispira sanaruensis]